MPSMTDKVKAKLAKNPDPGPEQIQKWADEIGCSTSLVYKWRGRVGVEALEKARRVSEASQPIITVDEETEIIEEPAIEEEPSEFEVPEEFTEEPTEVPQVERPEEIVEEEAEEEEEELLNDIGKRAIKRLFGLAIDEGLGLGEEYGLTDQESKDTQFLAMLLIAKYAMIEIRENILEITSGLHFGSVGLKLLVAWIKKRREEAKEREEEEERRKEQEKPAPKEPAKTEEEKLEPAEKEEPKVEPARRGADGLTDDERRFKKRHIH